MNIKIVLIAGEPSGDSIGANLIKSILKEIPSTEFFGIGGEKMIGISAPLREERTIEREYSKKVFSSWFPMEDIAIMGFIEIAHKLLSIRKRINETIENILRCDPDVVITIDSPGFSTRVVKALRDRCFINPILHYGAPTVWAYNPERAKKFAQLYDHMLCILPFEKHYFDKVGLDATFVGHPVLENSDIKSNKNDVKKKYGIDQSTKLLTVTPGSRVGELNRHLHIFRKAVQLIKQKEKNIKIFVPTLPHLKNRIEEAFDDAIISDDSKIKSELS